jgi:hypothetical protein
MADAGPRYDDLAALYINCTLKPSPQLSHTQGLIDVSAAIMRKQGVRVETIRAVDHDIATGVWPDMTEHGALGAEEADTFEAHMSTCDGCRVYVEQIRETRERLGRVPPDPAGGLPEAARQELLAAFREESPRRPTG